MKQVLIAFFSATLILVSACSFGQNGDAQKVIDDRLINEHLAKYNLTATKTPSGLYYNINRPGTGEKAKFGKRVTMNYIGKLTNGRRFDGNIDAQFNQVAGRTPFTFVLGAGEVIKGWDEGIQLLDKGSRATLYLPSGLAYGSSGMGHTIPPNSILIFDVEVVDIEN